MDMETMENPALEPRAERIARYKAERRRELAERFGGTEELPSKWVRRNGKELHEPATKSHGGALNSDELGGSVNGRTQEVTNGVGVGGPAEANHLRGQGYQDSASMPGREEPLVSLGLDAPQLHTRVSVGQLRSALLQQTESTAQPEKVSPEAGRAASSLDLAVKTGSDGGRRRARHYLPGGSSGGRKTSERFRTQPITANEMEESSGLLDAEVDKNKEADVKTDDRSSMSVAAKMSLFKELEKSAAPQASALLRPRPASTCHERRTRRGNDHRFLTQPITCEEMVAVSTPTPVETDCVQAASVEDGDESCKMSMSEKLALFNKLSLPGRQGTGPTDGPPERRRQKGSRYRTQPITVEEVGLLQTDPVQLPAFGLCPHLSDRQQASSVNLKPSEVRLSQPRTDAGPHRPAQPAASLQEPQFCNPEPALKGILKKSCSAGSEWSRTEVRQLEAPLGHGLNGGSSREAEEMENQESSQVPRRERRVDGGSRAPAPWRQRPQKRRDTITCTAVTASPEQTAPQKRKTCQISPEQDISSVGNDSTGKVQGPEEKQESVTEAAEEKMEEGNVQVLVADGTAELQETTNGCKSVDDSASPHLDSVSLQFWTNLSFEAQEVSSPSRNLTRPQWRQKAKEAEQELQMVEGEDKKPHHEGEELPESDGSDLSHKKIQITETPAVTCEAPQPTLFSEHPPEVQEETPAGDSSTTEGGFGFDRSLPPTCTPTPCGGATATESEQDLSILCQSNTPILTSAVAEHRRAVRPSRRTQGSRNPLRALAAREDIRQDYMGDGVNTTAEEQGQAEKKRKNSSTSDPHPVSSESHTSPLDAETIPSHPPFSSLMLLHVKGRRHVQVRLVEPSARSLDSGDCFLLVTPEHCISWSGEFANEQERAKASELASFIQRHGDLGCATSHIVYLQEGLNSDSDVAAGFWSLLGEKMQYRGAGAPEQDELYEQGVVESNCVYRLVDNRLIPHEEAWASVPSTSLLSSTEALVFDFGSEVYLWHGRDVSPRRRSVALQLTHQVWAGAYDYSNCRVNPLDPARCNPSIQLMGEGRPSWALLAVVSEGNETSLFKEKFEDWACGTGGAEEDASVRDETQVNHTVQSCSVGVKINDLYPPQSESPSDRPSPCDAKALVLGGSMGGDGSVHMVLDGLDIQRGLCVITLEEGHQMELKTVAVDTWHVQEFDDSESPVDSTGQLHEADSYVIRWTYSFSDVEDKISPNEDKRVLGSQQRTAFFLWRGRHSRVSGRDTAAFLSIGMSTREDSLVVVPQGKEPPCFLQLFQGGLVIHKGKREEASFSAVDWRLFCVRGELPEEGLLLEVDCGYAGLRSRGSLVLLNSQQGVLYLWTGCKAQSSTKEVSKRAVEKITQMCPPELGLSKNSPVQVHLVEEGSEPADFWTALGQMDRKAYDCMLQDPGKYNFTPRLFQLSSSSGRFQAEELQSPTRLLGLVMAMPFLQDSLYDVPQPALFLLDNRLEVYLWQRGQTESSAPARSLWYDERKFAMQTALQYCKELNPRRPPRAYLIFEGSEPLTFTNIFPRWERRHGPHTQNDPGRVTLTLVQDALAQLMKTQPPPAEELLRSRIPEGVEAQPLEVYLSDQDFQTILQMKSDDCASHSSWKKTDLKKSKEVFC